MIASFRVKYVVSIPMHVLPLILVVEVLVRGVSDDMTYA
jgi:hypothetical protein